MSYYYSVRFFNLFVLLGFGLIFGSIAFLFAIKEAKKKNNKPKTQTNLPPCEECGGTSFFPMPDSLALFCEKCGFVWVNSGPNKYEKGKSIQEWLEDTYGNKDNK